MSKLFVGGLAWATNDDSLRAAFEEFSPSDAVVLKDRETGRSRGFGFVTVPEAQVEAAINKWNDQELDGRRIKVQVAAPRESGGNGGFRSDNRGPSMGGYRREGTQHGYNQ